MVAKWSGVLSTTEPRNDIGILNVRQGNKNSEIAEFQIIENNKPYDLTGLTVLFCASFGLNQVEKTASIVNAKEGKISYTFDDDAMQQVGRNKGYFSIKKAEAMIDSTQEFEYRIQSSIYSRLIDAKSYILRLDVLIKLIEDFIYESKNNVSASIKSFESFITNEKANVNTWVDSMKEIIYGIDPGGSVLRELIEARKDTLNKIFPSLKARLDTFEKDTTAQFQQTKTDFNANLNYVEQSLPPKRYIFGKQLEALKTSLSNPLSQITEIEIAGDSIPWGLGATGNPIDYETGRNGTLTDIRDNYESKSFVNEFKRYIGSKYFSGATPILSNWSTSPKGQSIVEFKKDVILFPYGGDFTIENNLVALHEIRQLVGTLTGWEINSTWASETDASTSISFPFTGEEFTLSFQVTANSIKYELFVDEVSQGVFSTEDGVDGLSVGLDRRRKHVFPFVKNKIVKIKSVKTNKPGYQALKIGGIIVPKKVKISNQGIIGSTARTWVDRNLTSGIVSRGGFLFVQLGANDRATLATKPKGVNTFMDDLSKLLDKVKTDRNVILMCSNPVASENPAVFNFNMQDVRNTVFRLAKKENMDFVDNYSIFGTMPVGLYTVDGLHLNDYGNELVKRNIINSMEFN